jgi:hypothetical protein
VPDFRVDALDRTALAITLAVALVAGLIVLSRLYFGGQLSHWLG